MSLDSTTEFNELDRDLDEGLRLVRAFRRIKEPLHRQRLLELAEQLSLTSANRDHALKRLKVG